LIRLLGDFDLAEEARQEAFTARQSNNGPRRVYRRTPAPG
jgi:predicted RNA polymerase sigma factor